MPRRCGEWVQRSLATELRLTLATIKTARLVFVLSVGLILAGCASQPAAPAPDAASLLQQIPDADAAKFPDMKEAGHWRNPYLVVRTDKVGLLTGVTASEERILKPDELLDALAHLPASAWPYGRAVAILVDKPGKSDQDRIDLRRNRGVVAGKLEEAHVAIRWMNTP